MLESVAERHRGEEVPQAETSLDSKGLALESALPHVLSDHDAEIARTVNLVSVVVDSNEILSVCRLLKTDPTLRFDFLTCLCVVDYSDYMQVVYHLYSTFFHHMMTLKANVETEQPHLSSVTSLWSGADWFERESHDLFGVLFDGHPNMTPLLLYEGFEGYPGRRNYDMREYTEW